MTERHRSRWCHLLRFASAHALQLWIGAGFALMAWWSMYATAPRYTAVWPYLFALVSVLSVASAFRPDARMVTAATGSLITMVSLARIVAVGEFYWPLLEAPHAVLHLLLWGLHVVVGMRWPQVVHDSSLRYAVEEAREFPPPPDLKLGE